MMPFLPFFLFLSFIFCYCYAGTIECIRYRFLYRIVFTPIFWLFISFHLYRRSSVGPIRNDSIISVSAIQYRCIYTNIYTSPFLFYHFSRVIWNTRTVDSFFFFVLSSIFPTENRGIFHYDLDCFYLDYTVLFLLSHFTLLLFLSLFSFP